MKISKIILTLCAAAVLCSCSKKNEDEAVISSDTVSEIISETKEESSSETDSASSASSYSSSTSDSKSESSSKAAESSDTFAEEKENETDTISANKAEASVTEIEEISTEITVTVQTNAPQSEITEESITSSEKQTKTETTSERQTTVQTEETAILPALKSTADIDYLDFFSDSLFIGDSICSGLKVYAGLLDTPHVAARVNVSSWGIGKYTFQYLNNSSYEKSALDIVKYYKPKDIYIWMGMNDLYVVSEKKFCDNMCSLAESYIKASPDSRVHIVSISPMTKSHKWNTELDGNNRINTYNKAMKERCEETDYLDFINIHDLLINSEGFLASDNNGGDGIHLSASAYKIVLNGIYNYMISLPEPVEEEEETESSEEEEITEITSETQAEETSVETQEESTETTTVPDESEEISEEESAAQSRIRELLDKFKV